MIKINTEKATVITMDKVRVWRGPEFSANDITLQNAIADSDDVARASAINRRDYLRDLPQQCEGKSVSELTEIIRGLDVESL